MASGSLLDEDKKRKKAARLAGLEMPTSTAGELTSLPETDDPEALPYPPLEGFRKVREAEAAEAAPDAPEVAPATHSTEIGAGSLAAAIAPRPGMSLSSRPSDKEVQGYLDKLRTAKREAAPGSDTSFLDRAEKEARELYESRADRADWLSVAEGVGNALVRLGAAEAGLRAGVDTSGIDLGPGVDWDKKITRYGGDRDLAITRLDRERGALGAADEREQRRLDQIFSDRREADKAGLSHAENKYSKDHAAYTSDRRSAFDAAAREASDIRKEARDGARQDARDDKILSDRDFRERKLDLQLEQERLKEVLGNETAATAAAGIIDRLPDLSAKTIAKLEGKQAETLAKAGISPSDLAEIESDAEKAAGGWFSGKSVEDEKRKLIQERIIEPRRAEVSNIKARIRELQAARGTAPARQEPAGDATLSEQDKQALAWARDPANAGKPQVAAILERLGRR